MRLIENLSKCLDDRQMSRANERNIETSYPREGERGRIFIFVRFTRRIHVTSVGGCYIGNGNVVLNLIKGD